MNTLFYVFHGAMVPAYIKNNDDARIHYLNNRTTFKRVARVDADTLSKVYELTNHVDTDWNENSEVTMLVERARSTSIGDLIAKVTDDAIDFFMVGNYGFEEI